MQASAKGLGNLWVLMVTAFVDSLGAFLVLALLPFYAERYGASPLQVGGLVAAFALAQAVTAPAWGRVSDRFGRRPVLLAGLAISAVSYVGFAAADSLGLLLLSRLGQGVGGGTIGVIFAYITDAVVPRERTSGIGWVTSATSAGFMVGPAAGSLLGRIDPAAPWLFAAVLCGLNFVFAWWLLPEPAARRRAPESGTDLPRQRGALRRALSGVVRRPWAPLSSLIWIYTFGMLAYTALIGIVALYLERRFGVSDRTIGLFFVYVGGISLLVRALILGPLVTRLGEVRVLRLGALVLFAGMVLMPLATDVVGLAAAILLIPVGMSLLFPCTTAQVSRHAPSAKEVGQLLGVQQAFGGVSKIIGPLWAGAAFQNLSIESPFWIGGAVVLLAGLLASRLPVDSAPAAEPAVLPSVDPASPEGL